MIKKLLIIVLVLFGLSIGIMIVSAEETTLAQSVTSTVSTPPNTNIVSNNATSGVPITLDESPKPLIYYIGSGDITVPEVNLKPGTKNNYVKKLQEVLKVLGYLPDNLVTTEYLGPLTKEAIVKFQKDEGLTALGYFGPATRIALKNRLQNWEKQVDKNVDVGCMKTAVEKRENALLSAWDTYAGKIKAAREIRRNDLLTDWSILDPKERNAAIETAWHKYRDSVKITQTEWNQSKKIIWDQFIKDAKYCRASMVETKELEKVEVPEE